MTALYNVTFDITDRYGRKVGGGACQIVGTPTPTTTVGRQAMDDGTAALIRAKIAAQGRHIDGTIVVTSIVEAAA